MVKLRLRRTKVHGRKSIVTIVLLAVSASFMYAPAPIAALFLSNYAQYNPTPRAPGSFSRDVKYELAFFLTVSFLPQITSVLNPVILLVLGSQLQDWVRETVLRCKAAEGRENMFRDYSTRLSNVVQFKRDVVVSPNCNSPHLMAPSPNNVRTKSVGRM